MFALSNNVWLWAVTSNECRYHERWLLLHFSIAPISNALILYCIGVFGPLQAMFVFNVYAGCLEYQHRVRASCRSPCSASR